MTDELTPSLTATRSPFNVRCGSCKHVWTAAWLPMEMSACARLLLGARCPACGHGPKGIFVAHGEAVSPVPPQRTA